MKDANDLHSTLDAGDWAKAFCARYPYALCQIEGKEGVIGGDDFEHIMLGWFANAIMTGVDSTASIRARTPDDAKAALDALLKAEREAGRVEGLREALTIVGTFDEESDCPHCCDVIAINEAMTALLDEKETVHE